MAHSDQVTSNSVESLPVTSPATEPDLRNPNDFPGAMERRKASRESGLRGKVVVITGAGAGIGRATAMRFAEEGAIIAAWDVSAKAGSQLESAVKWAGGSGFFQAVNVTNAAEVESAAQEVMERCKRIDVLINNAGIVRDAQLVSGTAMVPSRSCRKMFGIR